MNLIHNSLFIIHNSFMFILSFIRIIKFSLQNIFRNIWLSVVIIVILTLALFSINILLLIKVISNITVDVIKEKIDINLYIKADTNENEILSLKAEINNLNQVRTTQYISKANALEIFKKTNQNNPEILQALRELGKNPLMPSIIIKPKNTTSPDDLINELNKINSDIIESRRFTNYELVLDKINNITDKANKIGLFISLIFASIMLLVVYNTMRIAIHSYRKEIGVMKLVGASNLFIHLPFLFTSIIYTLFGVIIAGIIFYLFLILIQPYLNLFLGYNTDLVYYFKVNFVKIFGVQFIGIGMVNILATWIAIRKYARV